MNLNQQSVLIQSISLDDLRKLISDIFETKLGELNPQPSETTEFLSRQETASLLKISLPTLNQITKSGLLKGYRISTRVLYKRHEIESSIMEIQTQKHRRA